tara:strand:+ start:36 stop:989 length:954 start_codon:yes stop_codon:yes gene_type:complete
MRIPVVFCFDNNFCQPAYVAIASLLSHANKETVYHVYCILSKNVTEKNKLLLSKLSNDRTVLDFIEASNRFDKAHQPNGITEAAYYRLLLHKLIPKEDKVIYLDVDVLVNDDLSAMFSIELDRNILAAVKNLYIYQTFDKQLKEVVYWNEKFNDAKNSYFNSGVLLLNLAEIRSTYIWREWLELLLKEKWEYLDQDILNITCRNKTVFLPPKYNATYAIRAKGSDQLGLFSKDELTDTPVIYHFTAKKPWNAKYMNQSDVWWSFIKEYDITKYRYFLKRYRESQTPNVKLQRFYQRSIQIVNGFLRRLRIISSCLLF